MVQRPTDQEKSDFKRVMARQEAMELERSGFEANWDDCYKYIMPRRGRVTSTDQPGNIRGDELFDSTATLANQRLSGALHSMLTNQATRFFELAFGIPDLDDDEEVKSWLQKVTDLMHDTMNNSNFQTEIHELYQDLGGIGTSCMFIGEHAERIVHFMTRAMKEIFVQENNLGLIDVVHRKFKWNLRQIVQEFGEACLTPDLLKLYNEGNSEQREILHVVEPSLKKGYFAFDSKYFLVSSSITLSGDKGFKEFPYVVPRWTKNSGESYGRGPGMDALPDVKMANAMKETTLQGGQLAVGPPIMVDDDNVLGSVQMTPFGITVVRKIDTNPIRPINANSRVDFGQKLIENTQHTIDDHFFVNQMQLGDTPQMTATEVNQRTQEMLKFMGPVLGRQHFEFLKPTVERVYAIMERKGLIPPPPPKAAKKRFEVKYSSLIARAQKMGDGSNLSQAFSVASPIANAIPSALDIIDGDKALRYIFDIYGVPQKIMNSEKTIKETRDARAKAQQKAAQEAQEQHAADLVQKAGPSVVQAQQGPNQQ